MCLVSEVGGLLAEPRDCISGRPEQVADFSLSHCCCCCFVFISSMHDLHYAASPLTFVLTFVQVGVGPLVRGCGWTTLLNSDSGLNAKGQMTPQG